MNATPGDPVEIEDEITVVDNAPLESIEIQDEPKEINEEKDIGFYRYKDGYLMCDQLSVRDIFDKATYKPFYLMSKSQLRANF